MKAKPFKHDFSNPFITDVNGITGYLAALRQIYLHIADVTEFKPEKRYIDAVDILDRITETTKELEPILEKEQSELKTLLNM